MKYIITNHAKQRRVHHTPKEETIMQEWMKAYDKYFDFSLLEDGQSYKIHARGNTAVLKKKAKYLIVLITFKSYFKTPDMLDFNRLRISKTENREARLLAIHRVNFNGKVVKCGRVLKNTQSKERYTLSLKKSLDKKFEIPCFRESIIFNDFREVEQFVNKDENDGLYYLNQFKRKANLLQEMEI